MHRYLLATFCLLSLFLLPFSLTEATEPVGETSIGIKFEADTTGGGVPTTPPILEDNHGNDNPFPNENLPQTGSQDNRQLIVLGVILALATIYFYARVRMIPITKD